MDKKRIILVIIKNNRAKSPAKFQKKATKDANLVLTLKKKEDIRKNQHTPIISQNKNKKIQLKEITYVVIAKKKTKKTNVNHKIK